MSTSDGCAAAMVVAMILFLLGLMAHDMLKKRSEPQGTVEYAIEARFESEPELVDTITVQVPMNSKYELKHGCLDFTRFGEVACNVRSFRVLGRRAVPDSTRNR